MSLLIRHLYRFGEFAVDADQKVLLREGKPLPLTPKVFETLAILVENSGRIVEKEQLMNRLWPDTFVEESNLTFNIQQLRKSLGDNARKPQYIETVSRRGYRFIANVEEVLSNNAGGQITGSFENFNNAVVPRASEIAGHELTPIIAVTKQVQPPIGPTLDTEVKTDKFNYRPFAVIAAALILLAGGGFVLWKVSNASNTNSKNKNSAGTYPGATALKVEKLTGTGQSHFVAISPDGKYVAYTRGINKEVTIWLRQLASNTNVEIVPASGSIYGLAFDNSGEYVYFVQGNPTALYRVSLLGGLSTKIVDNLEGKFSISAGDSQIAFIRSRIGREGQREYSLLTANVDGSNEHTLLTRTYPQKLDAPLWSPEGESILFAEGSADAGSQDTTIEEIKVSDGTNREWSSNRFQKIIKMAWLPRQSGLIISAAKADIVQLWRLSYPQFELSQLTDGSSSYADLCLTANAEKAVVTLNSRISDIWVGPGAEPRSLRKLTQAIDNFCWTTDGRIVYSSAANGNSDLWIMKADGTEQRQLTVDEAGDGTPAVTADNRYVSFVSNRTGSFQVWRMNIDGGNQLQLTKGNGKNYPSVSPDGKWVLYNTTDDWHLWMVSIDGGEPLPVTDYIASYPSVSPDGKMIACLGRNGSFHQLLIIPFEGGQPLKRIDLPAGDLSAPRIQWTRDGHALIYLSETAILKQTLAGGLPEKIGDLIENDVFDFGYSFDGKLLAATRGEWQQDVVLINDLNRH